MPGVLKAILVFVGVLVLMILVAVGVGWYWWSHHGQELIAAAKASHEEGQGFGKGTDNAGCVTEALSRRKKSTGFGDMIANNLFLKACLGASRTTEGFCDGVPKKGEIMQSATWQVARCAAVAPGDQSCNQLFGQVQEYCDSKAAPGGGAGAAAGAPPSARATPAR